MVVAQTHPEGEGRRTVGSPLIRITWFVGSVLAYDVQHFADLGHGVDQVVLNGILLRHNGYLQSVSDVLLLS